ncbi:MAG: YIP1 family protein [Verrucomicrobia bacterium]|nr:YIP1 family protein [Verrucomicrobiota bacterium]
MRIDLNLIVARIKNILLEPNQEWDAIKREDLSVAQVYARYLFAAAAIPALAHFVGQIISVYSTLPIAQMPLGISKAVGRVALYYALWLGSVYVTAFLINQLAPTFRSLPNMGDAVKLAGFSWLVVWTVGILLVVPMLRQLLVLALFYAIYVLHLGLPKLMGTPHDKVIPFTVVLGVAMFLLFIITGAFCGSL